MADRERLLTGRQVVTVVVAICVTAVLTPASVYAAKTQRVSLSDEKRPAQTARVTGGRLLTAVDGRVAVKGTPSVKVSGPVGATPRAPGAPWHAEAGADNASNAVIATIPAGRRLVLTTLNAMAVGPTGGWNQITLRVPVSGVCNHSSTRLETLANYALTGSTPTAVITYPAGRVIRTTTTPVCLFLSSANSHSVVLDGYWD